MNKIKSMSWRIQSADRYKMAFYISLLLVGITTLLFLPEHSSFRGASIGYCIGLIVHLRITWISRTQIGPESLNHTKETIYKLGYSQAKHDIWVPRLHRLLRFDAQNIIFKETKSGVMVTGPAYMLKKIAKSINDIAPEISQND
ncbi:hypothetical protein [Xanthomonas sp. MUS 060]|uniref:hypothetical protein n=1 Tax=Xanthomonas sp. MUS 060 TaxID=1588031 RepID=UPI000ADB71E6|nr:hypothetical protein [Xanthomonas sp. MUS 060]